MSGLWVFTDQLFFHELKLFRSAIRIKIKIIRAMSVVIFQYVEKMYSHHFINVLLKIKQIKVYLSSYNVLAIFICGHNVLSHHWVLQILFSGKFSDWRVT